ncbi:MauE/DoxX family redox-associated membrane protein [Chryseobacterium balustinum]|uniref:Methylamine utilisation protein MauE domain-containing protein n=1 Tax=Chryseobacterium balustinum TaxID=246 RepID=A0AAX2INB1_9FLAO|nr:MauE/DoxX family redox-associated membrane protein [Chryseobacterium balustinum]AZB30266.1 tellurium resistance protein TerC [Chryseobacterium balustinum]SKC03479.1 hypothetical protein SAMN05421800_12255 [Chryseobacterium balustinum]SQA90902.1 Uncharacterised protein [Chryseobacterium balustinum]
MKKSTRFIVTGISYFFILLFIYASISKMMDFENFQVQIGQSPLLSAYAGFVSYAVIIAELLIVLMLIFPKTFLLGLHSSTALMTAFTVYIYLILNYSDFVPCSCGGILEKLGWTEHLIFNISAVVLGIVAVFLYTKKEYPRKTVILSLVTSNILSAVLILFLFLRSDYVIKKENNFTRRFLMHPVLKTKSIALENNTYYFAGSDNQKVYLGNRTMPQNLLTVDSSLKKRPNLKMDLDLKKYPYRKIEVKVYGNNYFIYDGTVPVISRGQLGRPETEVISYKDAFFSQIEIINSNRMAIRALSSTTKNLTLGVLKIGSNGKNEVQLFPKLLEKQSDGVFDSDGYLSSNPKSAQVTYIHAYRNQFLVMDSTMELQRRLSTIDTTTTAQIKVTPLSDGRFKMSKPALLVNGHAKIFNGLLFNPAYLRGQHEPVKRWKESRTIDVYNINKQEYIGSIYIDHYKDSEMSDFAVTDKHLYVIAGNQLIQYRLTNSLTKYFKNGVAENRIQE